MHVSSRLPLSARLLCAACLLAALPAAALERVTLQLKWTHAFQFAGYYAAKELGFYEKAGLDVRLAEAGPGIDPLEEVLAGRAQYGVGTSSLVVERGRGKPVVALAVIFQHSPQVFIGSRSTQTRGLKDLVGKRVMLEPQSLELEAFLRKEGVAPGDLRILPHSHDPRDLIDGKVDAMSAYLTYEPYFLDRASFPYRIYAPRELGLDFYGDNLFTTERELRQHPARAAAFRDASLRGWAYAMEHPQEIADLILARYSREHPRAFYLHEAVRMTALVTHELVEIGHMNPGRWRQIAETYAEMGMMPAAAPLEGFLYEPGLRVDLRRYYPWIAAAFVLLAGVGGLALYVQRTNLRLRRALETSRQAQQALREGDRRLRLLAEHASDVIWTRDLEGRFTYVSPSVTRLRGFTVEEVMAQSVEDAYTPESAALIRQNLARLMAAAADGRPAHEFRGEFELRCKGGATIWVETTLSELRDADGRVSGVVGVTRDVSARRAAEQRMSELALHDALTGLPNRTLFSDRLQQALVAAQRERRRLAVMFIDLDRFKPVNDRHGHAVGDLLLKEVAHRMLACVRGSDTVARIGGDEFVVLLRTVEGGPFALAVAEKIRHAIDQAFEVAGLRLQVSCCVGIALYPDDGTNEIDLAKNADAAMYWAKEHGRGNVQLYRPEMARAA